MEASKEYINANISLAYNMRNGLRQLVINTLKAIGQYDFTEQDEVEMTTWDGAEYNIIGFRAVNEGLNSYVVKAISIDDPDCQIQTINTYEFDAVDTGMEILRAISDKWEQDDATITLNSLPYHQPIKTTSMNKKIYQIRVTEGESTEGVMDCLTSYDVFCTKEDAVLFAELYSYGSGVKDYEIDEYNEEDIEDFHIVEMPDLNDTFTEYCPHCDKEVELKYEFRVQRCPSCGKLIVPCNLCNHVLCDCGNCPLKRITSKLHY